MSKQVVRPDTGIHSVEGTIAGHKAAKLAKKREKDQANFEAKRRKIQEEHEKAVGGIDQKFRSATHNAFNLDFVGLKTKEEFKNLRNAAEEEFLRKHGKDEAAAKLKELEEKRRKKLKESKQARLSFAEGDEDEGKEDWLQTNVKERLEKAGNAIDANGTGEAVPSKRKVLKNPEAVTDFLPDPERDREEKAMRERLKRQWLEEQEKIKEEVLEVTYSYWDGSGHRRVLNVKKGTTIAKFLELVKSQVAADFSEVRAISPDDLMYIKEDLIIPHSLSFYDLIVTKARGKSGPLFHFDIHEDVRMVHDVRIEKDESHPGKVVDRKWYERHKHIFPASRWEIFDIKSQRTDAYTTHGKEVNAKK